MGRKESLCLLPAEGLIVQYMRRNTTSKKNEEQPEPPGLRHKHSAIEECNPHKAHRDNLHTQRDCLILAEILYIHTQTRVRQQPIVKAWGTSEEQCCRQQEERRSGQYRQKNAHHTQCQRNNPQCRQQVLHHIPLICRREDTKKMPYKIRIAPSCL